MIKNVNDYNYQRIRRKLAESGELRNERTLEELKTLEKEHDVQVEKEESYDKKRAGIIHKNGEEEYNCELARKQLRIK